MNWLPCVMAVTCPCPGQELDLYYLYEDVSVRMPLRAISMHALFGSWRHDLAETWFLSFNCWHDLCHRPLHWAVATWYDLWLRWVMSPASPRCESWRNFRWSLWICSMGGGGHFPSIGGAATMGCDRPRGCHQPRKLCSCEATLKETAFIISLTSFYYPLGDNIYPRGPRTRNTSATRPALVSPQTPAAALRQRCKEGKQAQDVLMSVHWP